MSPESHGNRGYLFLHECSNGEFYTTSYYFTQLFYCVFSIYFLCIRTGSTSRNAGLYHSTGDEHTRALSPNLLDYLRSLLGTDGMNTFQNVNDAQNVSSDLDEFLLTLPSPSHRGSCPSRQPRGCSSGRRRHILLGSHQSCRCDAIVALDFRPTSSSWERHNWRDPANLPVVSRRIFQ